MRLLSSAGRLRGIGATTVSTADLWEAIEALDAILSTHVTDWYKRLVAADPLPNYGKLSRR